jgi:hypothetical protein
VNQTRAVLEALFGRETEFVRTPKHGIRGRLEAWSSKKYRAAKSITPFLELGMAAYFAVAMVVALDHGHYMSMPFLALFLAGFGYVGWVSLWQGGTGVAIRAFASRFIPARRRAVEIVPPPAFPLLGSKLTDLSIDAVGGDASVNDSAARHIARA